MWPFNPPSLTGIFVAFGHVVASDAVPRIGEREPPFLFTTTLFVAITDQIQALPVSRQDLRLKFEYPESIGPPRYARRHSFRNFEKLFAQFWAELSRCHSNASYPTPTGKSGAKISMDGVGISFTRLHLPTEGNGPDLTWTFPGHK